MKSLQHLAAIVPLVFLASCATTFTPAQREALSTVAIAPTVVKSDAYAEPYGGDRQAAAAVPQATGGGIIPALIGESIAATQDSMFRGNKKALFSSIQANTPQVGPIFTGKLSDGVKSELFFKSRVRATSPNTITSTITSYRLVRNGKINGELQFVPQIVAELSLNDASGKSLAKGTYVGTGYGNPIEVFSSSAVKSKEGYELAARVAVDQFTSLLARKTAE